METPKDTFPTLRSVFIYPRELPTDYVHNFMYVKHDYFNHRRRPMFTLTYNNSQSPLFNEILTLITQIKNELNQMITRFSPFIFPYLNILPFHYQHFSTCLIPTSFLLFLTQLKLIFFTINSHT